MNTFFRPMRGLAFLAGLIGFLSVLRAQPAEATSDEAAWFAGEWTVTPAPVEGFDDVVTEVIATVRIEHLDGARIARHSPEQKGRPAVTVEFIVRKLGATYPWWPDEGPAVVTRRVSATVFDLATVGPMGRADWDRALRHTRQPPSAKEPCAECDERGSRDPNS